DDVMALAIRVNDFLSGLFLGVGIRLVDFKMETGRLWENDLMRIVVADEISPDSCRLWDIKSNEKLDKDRFRRDLGGLLEAYTEVAKRLGIMKDGERPQGSGPVLVKSGAGSPAASDPAPRRSRPRPRDPGQAFPSNALAARSNRAHIGCAARRTADESPRHRHAQIRHS